MEASSLKAPSHKKIIIVAVGTRGDVQPYLALAVELKKRGHEIVLMAPCGFQSFIESNGITYGYMNNFILDMLESPAGKQAMHGGISFFSFIKSAIKLWKDGVRIANETMEDLWKLSQTFSPDLIVYHPKGGYAVDIAEKLEIPCIMASPLPLLVPTVKFPAMGMPDWPLGSAYRRWSYTVVYQGYKSFDKLRAKFRKETLSLPPLPKKRTPISKSDGSPIPVLHAYSSELIPHPEDWPDTSYTTGYWFLEDDVSDDIPQDLIDFINAGDPPVCVGFGSMSGKDPAKSTRIIIDALRECGLRAVLISSFGGLHWDSKSDDSEANDIFHIQSIPHDWLFPRVSMVVHHGGAGTTAATIKAGKPSIVCPFIIDQPFWGRKLAKRGVGTKIIPHKKLTVKKLVKAFNTITSSASYHQKSSQLGERIRLEKGVQKAAEIIEEIC